MKQLGYSLFGFGCLSIAVPVILGALINHEPAVLESDHLWPGLGIIMISLPVFSFAAAGWISSGTGTLKEPVGHRILMAFTAVIAGSFGTLGLGSMTLLLFEYLKKLFNGELYR